MNDKLTWHDYIPLAMRTNSDSVGSHGTRSIDWAHAALGIHTELHEVLTSDSDINMEEELSDVCWFLALIMKHLPYHFETNINTYYDTTTEAAVEISEIAKRLFAYGKMKDGDERKMYEAVITIKNLLKLNDSHRIANIAKLKARFPDGFSQDDALNRDKEAEYAAIGNVKKQ